MSTIETRREQMFPQLDPAEIDRLAVLGWFGGMPRVRLCS